MAANDPTATVQRMFDAFGAGDIDALLETVHSESHWTSIGANPRVTRAELTGHAAVLRTHPRSPGDDRVRHRRARRPGRHRRHLRGVAGTVRASGEPFRNAWVQEYVVEDGLIVEMVEYNIQVEPRG